MLRLDYNQFLKTISERNGVIDERVELVISDYYTPAGMAENFRVQELLISSSTRQEIQFGDNIQIDGDLVLGWGEGVTFGENLSVGRDLNISRMRHITIGEHLQVYNQVNTRYPSDSFVLSPHTRIGTKYLPELTEWQRSDWMEHPDPKLPPSTRQFLTAGMERIPEDTIIMANVYASDGLRIEPEVVIGGDLTWIPEKSTPPLMGKVTVMGTMEICLFSNKRFVIPKGSDIWKIKVAPLSISPALLILEPDTCIRRLKLDQDFQLHNLPSGFSGIEVISRNAINLNGGVSGNIDIYGDIILPHLPVSHWPLRHARGKVDLTNSQVKTFVPGAVFDKDLILNGTGVQQLNNATVGGDLYVRRCRNFDPHNPGTVRIKGGVCY